MRHPFNPPEYLPSDVRANVFATPKGWVLLHPNGKYEILAAIKNLDSRLDTFEVAAGKALVAQTTTDVTDPLVPALANSKKQTVASLLVQLAGVRAKLESVNNMIADLT